MGNFPWHCQCSGWNWNWVCHLCGWLDQIYYISLDPEFFDFLNFVNFRHVTDISETFHMAGTKQEIIWDTRWLSRCHGSGAIAARSLLTHKWWDTQYHIFFSSRWVIFLLFTFAAKFVIIFCKNGISGKWPKYDDYDGLFVLTNESIFLSL
jgi:hypothetical protein